MDKFGVVVSPGPYFFLRKETSEDFRICIDKTDEEEITEGLSRLGKALYHVEQGI